MGKGKRNYRGENEICPEERRFSKKERKKGIEICTEGVSYAGGGFWEKSLFGQEKTRKVF